MTARPKPSVSDVQCLAQQRNGENHGDEGLQQLQLAHAHGAAQARPRYQAKNPSHMENTAT